MNPDEELDHADDTVGGDFVDGVEDA